MFEAPWQAQAFAMVLALQDRGLFTPAEWSSALGSEIERSGKGGGADAAGAYWCQWLRALEGLVAGKQLADGETLATCRDAWARAAGRTPHGSPIELLPEDFLT